MRLLVSGCAGFIGSAFCRYILKNYPSDEIIGVDLMTYAASPEALAELRQESLFHFYTADICDLDAMDRIFLRHSPEVVVNFAAETHVDRSINRAGEFVRTNILGTQILLDASVKYGVSRLHQISTDEVYGDTPLDSAECFSEDAPLRPSSPYSASKAAADLLALSYMRTHGLSVSISRSVNNFGIYQHSEKLIPTIIGSILSGRPAPIYGDGGNIRDWLYVTDHCRAVDLIIRRGDVGIYNVGADNYLSNIDLAARLFAIMDSDPGLEHIPDRKGHDLRYAVDSSKLRSLGWTPSDDFDSDLRATVEWYRAKNRP